MFLSYASNLVRESTMIEQVRNLTYRAMLVVGIMLYIINRMETPWIVIIPEGTNAALFPDLIGLGLSNDPWTKSISVRSNYYAKTMHLTPRRPLASGYDFCVTSDNVLLEEVCPYAVPLKLDMSSSKSLEYIFPLLNNIYDFYPDANISVNVSKAAVVTVNLENYQIVLGRKQLLERFIRAKNIITSTQWQHKSGRLDMRYSDGFAWKESNLLDG